jgi:hypothetical protein
MSAAGKLNALRKENILQRRAPRHLDRFSQGQQINPDAGWL